MKHILRVVVIMICCSCSLTTWLSGDFTYHENNHSHQLNTSGIYMHHYYTSPQESVYHGHYYYFIIPYQNGVMYGFSSLREKDTNCSSISKIVATREKDTASLRNTKYNWGAYKTEGDSIKIQSILLDGVPAAFGPYGRVVEHHGIILSDTSFVLTQYFNGKEKIEGNQLYILHKCNARPDSSYFPFYD